MITWGGSWEVKYMCATRAIRHWVDSEPGASNAPRSHGARRDIGHAQGVALVEWAPGVWSDSRPAGTCSLVCSIFCDSRCTATSIAHTMWESTRALRWSTLKKSTTVNGQLQVRSLGCHMLCEKVDMRDRSARRDWLGKVEVPAVPEPAAWKTVEKRPPGRQGTF